ncbi:MAG: hypothetical protein M1834_009300 [Cirrosporium novae-zelandiae]|nr:MAG: hypothetical protein M1834_009300 [Cirrosporium novae-zelandiae]
MRITYLLPLATYASAFVIPDDVLMNNLAVEPRQPTSQRLLNKLPNADNIFDEFTDYMNEAYESAKNDFDDVMKYASEADKTVSDTFEDTFEGAFDTKSWIDTAADNIESFEEHHGHHGKHGHSHKPNMTVYQLIASSKYTTKLAKLVNEFDDLVELLNGTLANYTVFAPTDRAFEKIPPHAPKPSKEILKKVLTYHVSSDFYPAGRILVSHTIPTLLKSDLLGGESQRLSTNIGFRGLTVNFYSRVIAVNIFGTNGVIHGVDSILIPPPKAAQIINLLPGKFSTLELGLTKTGLFKAINDSSTHEGGTIFAPSNSAFQKLGPRINAFLFSSYGLKYLKALLKYHVVANHTLYSDAYYAPKSSDEESKNIPKGKFHIDLPTLLDDRPLSIDITRFGRLIGIHINGFTEVTIEDGIARDGVIQVVSNVLIPPRHVNGFADVYDGGELTVEDLKERLGDLVEEKEEL